MCPSPPPLSCKDTYATTTTTRRRRRRKRGRGILKFHTLSFPHRPQPLALYYYYTTFWKWGNCLKFAYFLCSIGRRGPSAGINPGTTTTTTTQREARDDEVDGASLSSSRYLSPRAKIIRPLFWQTLKALFAACRFNDETRFIRVYDLTY